MQISIDEIKRRLKSKGFEEDELKALFGSDDKIKDFYFNVFLKAGKIGNVISKEEDAEEELTTKLTSDEERLAQQKEKIAKQKVKAIKQAAKVSVENRAEFDKAGEHLADNAGTPGDLDRLLKQLNEEEDDEDEDEEEV